VTSRDWRVLCKECGKKYVLYSERSRQEALARGQSPPERCVECRAKHSRAISRLAVKYLDMEPGLAIPETGVKAGRFGRLDRPPRPHTERQVDGFRPPPPDTFGIQDDEVSSFLTDLERENKRVAVIVAGTGSGKSTFLPWRLLVPPPPFPEDYLTRHGKIIVTQPRIEASTGIPNFVAQTLHASVAGPGTDIGYINSKSKDKSDPRNKLVYVTDGTLVNMIRRGDMHEVSTVVIDEAHERSLNIDLILALLRRELPGLPHLKVFIVSATIDTETFRAFFEPDFPVLVRPMRSKGIYPVHERWWPGPELPQESWAAQMPSRAASTVVEILRWMIVGASPADIPESVPAYDGDILVFLTGRSAIETAIKETEELIVADPDLAREAGTIELLPLYSELPPRKRDQALKPELRRKQTKYRVIYSTNLAETSLTIEGVRHVVDSGLINRSKWDPASATQSLEAVPHSQHGLRQRRGRAGRTAPGIWHCLYTRAQFDQMEVETPPEIVRAPLPAVLLAAAVAGVSDPASLRWLPPGPPPGEVDRALAALRAIGALSEDGDPTPVGRELASTRADFDDAAILVAADQIGCAIEAATVLAAKSSQTRTRLLRWSRGWPASAKVHVDDVHEAFFDGAADDVDVVCRLFAAYETQLGPEAQAAWAQRHYVDLEALRDLDRDRKALLQPLMAKTRASVVRPLDLRLLNRVRAAIAWANPNAMYKFTVQGGQDDRAPTAGELEPFAGPRSDSAVIAAMHAVARPLLDEESWVTRHPPQDPARLVLLDRQLRKKYLTPLAPPQLVLQATFCVVVPDELVVAGEDWLTSAVEIRHSPAPPIPAILPGDRFYADLLGNWGGTVRLRLLTALPPMPDPTVEIADPGGGAEEPEDGLSDETRSRDVGGHETSVDDEPDNDRDDAEADEDTTPDAESYPAATAVPYPQADLSEIEALLSQGYADRIPPGSFDVVVERVENGAVVCAPDIKNREFTSFVDANLGSTADFVLDRVRLFPRDRRPVVFARHPPTGFITPIDSDQIGTGLRYPQLRTLAPGTGWRFTVAGADRERHLLELTQTGATIAALTRLAGDRAPYRALGTIVDVYLDAVYIALIPDGERLRADDPPIVIRVFARDLPQVPQRVRLGATVDILLSWRNRHENISIESLLRSRPDLRIPIGPWEQQGEKLVATGPLTVSDWERLSALGDQIEDAVEAARYRANVAWLARRSVSHRSARLIDQQSLDDAIQRGTDAGVVTAVHKDGAISVATPLGEEFVPARQARMLAPDGATLAVGTQVPVYYTAGRDGPGAVTTHFFDPNARSQLSTGDLVLCRLGGLTAKGGERHVHTDAGVEGLADRQSLADAAEAGDFVAMRVMSLPAEGPVRMSGRCIKQRLELTDTGVAGLQRNAPDRREPWDLRAFSELAGGHLDIDLEYADGRSAQMTGPRDPAEAPAFLVTYRNGTDEGATAADRVHAAMTGHLALQVVPHFNPLYADRRAVLRAISDEHSCLLITGRLAQDDGRYENAVWIAGPSQSAVLAAATQVTDAFPSVWTSQWFKRTGAEWQAAREAVRSLPGRLRSQQGTDGYGRRVFRAIIDCPAEDLAAFLATARVHCPDMPDGSFTRDPDLRSCQFLTAPAGWGAREQHQQRAGQVAVSSGGPGHLELWAVRADNQLWHCWWPQDGGWSRWHIMDTPSQSPPGCVAACARAEWNHYVLLADSDGTAWARRHDGTWLEWERMPLSGVGDVAVSSAALGHLEMWATLAGGLLAHRWTTPGGWSAWTQMQLPEGVRAASVAAGSRMPGHQQVLVADDDGLFWTRVWEDHGGWGAWTDAGLEGVTAAALSSAGAGHLEMWAVQRQGNLLHRWWTQGSTWSSWETMGRPGSSGLISVASGSPGQWTQQVLAMDSAGQLWHRHYAGGWNPWNAVF
jgi:hypothetical protein